MKNERSNASGANTSTNSDRTNVRRGQKRGRFNKSKGSDRDDRMPRSDSRVCAGSQDNDPSWYSLNGQLLKDAASFPYAWPLGNRLSLGQFGGKLNKGSLPGVFAMHWMPTIGYGGDATSAVNVASINTYTKVRHDNSGHANYDHADYMMYLLAMDSVYAFHSWMRRVYGVALTYSNVNRYYPRAVIKAMGVDFDSIQKNLADFRQYINTFAVKASALAVPAKMSIMSKHYWMSQGLFFDSQQDKPQTYLFNPLGFYKFAITAGETPVGKLDFIPMFGKTKVGGFDVPCASTDSDATALTLESIVAYGDALLAPIISDEDFGIMSGDTLKSFGVGGCFTLPITEETYTVTPIYSGEVLDQIQNATFVGRPVIKDATITQQVDIGTGWIVADPTFSHPWLTAAATENPGQNAFLVNRFVTFEHGDIKPENTMEATRWTNIATEVTSTATRNYRVPTMGSEVMCTGAIVYYAVKTVGNSEKYTLNMSDPIYVSMDYNCDLTNTYNFKTDTSAVASIQAITNKVDKTLTAMNLTVQQLGVFDRHPAIYLTSFAGGNFTIQVYNKSGTQEEYTVPNYKYGTINGVLFDVNYYTVLSSSDLEEMSHIALLSEFDVTVR